jgi:hypothetical protein
MAIKVQNATMEGNGTRTRQTDWVLRLALSLKTGSSKKLFDLLESQILHLKQGGVRTSNYLPLVMLTC